MSKNRFDRKRKPEEWKSDYAAFVGGIDESSSSLEIKPGRLKFCLNLEEVFGLQGYSFVKGYERYDGRARPSQCTYSVLRFDAGSVAITVGNTVTNGGLASALAVLITLQSGSWAGGDAAGIIIITSVVSTWADNDPIKVGGVTRATASDDLESGSIGYDDNQTALTAAREYLRTLIQKPVGSGAILGAAVFNGLVYCVRNVVGDLTATLWKSSSTGWVSVKTGLHPSASYRFKVANFSGAADRLCLYGVNAKGRLFQTDIHDVTTFAAPIWGSEATSTTNVTIGTGAKTFMIAESTRDWTIGDALTVWNIGDVSKSMTGLVTAYNAGTGQLDMNITSVSGAGTLASWEIGRTDYSDKPFRLTEFKDHLFLAYPLGQLQSSNLGDPLVYTTTAALFGLGQEITDLVSLKGEALASFCEQKISILRGSSALDWDMGTYSDNTGAIGSTVEENGGNALFLDTKGVTSLQATQAFGDFESSIFSRDVKSTLDTYRTRAIGSRMARGNYQYRLYFDDGTHLRFTILTGNPLIQPRDVSATTAKYVNVPTCFCSGVMADGVERMFFGTDDGWLMEEDVGTSFDGEAIYYAARMPFNHFKAPASDKAFHKMELELLCPDPLTIYYRALFDYEDGTFADGSGSTDIIGEGGQFDVSSFDEFAFDRPTVSRSESPIDGIGRNMALLLWAESDFVRPATLQGVLTYFSTLGVRR